MHNSEQHEFVRLFQVIMNFKNILKIHEYKIVEIIPNHISNVTI
jgi:hypothetical protein